MKLIYPDRFELTDEVNTLFILTEETDIQWVLKRQLPNNIVLKIDGVFCVEKQEDTWPR